MRIHPIALFLLTFLLSGLLFPVSAFSQATQYYLGGGTVGFADDPAKASKTSSMPNIPKPAIRFTSPPVLYVGEMVPLTGKYATLRS